MATIKITVEFSNDQLKVLNELGTDEVAKRISELERYNRYTEIFTWGDRYGHALTPPQVIALANLATAMQKSYPVPLVVMEGGISRECTRDEMAATVARNEIWRREREAKSNA